jgi:hypothetical protein
MRQFETALGGNLSDGLRLAVSRAAVLTAIAEDARVRKLNGACDVNLDDLVRLDRVAAQAVKALGLPSASGKPVETLPPLRERLMAGIPAEDAEVSDAG